MSTAVLDPPPLCMKRVYSFNLSSPKPEHTPSGSVRGGARRDSEAGQERAAQDADGTVRPGKNSPPYPPDDGRLTSWVCPWKHEQRKFLCKPMEEQNPRLTTGLSAISKRDDGRSSFLVADQWTDDYLSL